MSQAGLADRAPAGGAAAQGFADKGRAAVFPRTEAAILPSVWHEPGGRRIGPIHGDGLHGFLADGAEYLAESGRIDRAGGRGGIQLQLIADFVRHPVADAGEPGLIEQEGLQRAAGVALQGAGDAGGGELGTEDFRGQGLPGSRRGGRGFIQADAAEHAEVAEDEGGRLGIEDEVVVGRGRVLRRAGEEFASHAEVAAQPEAAREFEEHVFPVGAGVAVGGAGQRGEG